MDPQGLTLASTNPSFEGKNYGFREYFIKAISGEPALYMAVGVTSKQPGYYFSHPIRENENSPIIGVAVLKLSPDFLYRPLVDNVLFEGDLMLIDKQGIVLYSNRKDRIYKSLSKLKEADLQLLVEQKRFPEGSFESMGYELAHNALLNYSAPVSVEFHDEATNRDKIISISQIEGSDFFVSIEEEPKKILASINAIASVIAGMVALCALFAMVGIYFLVAKFLKPLNQLTMAANKYSSGNFDFRTELKTGDEFENMGNVFNSMAKKLKAYYSSLESEVKKKTKQLNQKVKHLEELNSVMVGREIRMIELERHMAPGLSKKNKKEESQSTLDLPTQKDLSKLENLDDKSKAILHVLQDVAREKEKVTAEKQKIQAILESIGDGVFVVDENLNILVFNKTAETISGYSAKEAIGQKFSKILKFVLEKDGKVSDDFVLDAIETKKVQTMSEHTMLVRKDKTKVPVADSAAPIFNSDGEVLGCVVIFRDVTTEREIDRMKTEFISIAAHQLRTPLGNSRWTLEMLLDGDMGKLESKVENSIKEIQQHNVKLASLVDDLLDVSRINQGRVPDNPKKSDLFLLSKEAIKEQQAEIGRKKIKVDLKKTQQSYPKVYLDPKRFNDVIGNLLSNAIKYSRQKGLIKINFKLLKDFIEIRVSDSGIGIPLRDQKKIFSKFFRASNATNSKIDGFGLGLSVVKSYLESWGGSISFKSVEGKGVTFTIQVPLKPKKVLYLRI